MCRTQHPYCRPCAEAFGRFRALCEAQYHSVQEAITAYRPLEGDALDGEALTAHLAAINTYTGSHLADIRTMLAGRNAAHDTALLQQAFYALRYANETLAEALPPFSARYQQVRKSFYTHLQELVRLHDELKGYVKGKQLNPAASKWVEGYFRIFGEWFRQGADKSLLVLNKTVIAPLLLLNSHHPGAPFIHLTTENAMRCAGACDTLQAMDTRLQAELRQHAHRYRKALRFLAVVASHLELPQLREPRLPWYVYALSLLLLLTGPAACLLKRQPPSVPPAAPPVAHVQADTLPDKFRRLYAAPAAYGLDVSRYQGTLLAQVADYDSIHFVICKATEGLSMTDGEFAANWATLARAAVLRGAYHFFISTDDPVSQAAHFLQTVAGAGQADIPLIIDVEAGSVKDSISADSLQNRLLAALRYLEQHDGRTPIVYTGLSFADTYLRNEALAAYPLWLAEYSGRPSPVLPQTWKNKGHTFWQKSAAYVVHAEKTDFDIFNGSGAALAAFVLEGRR